MELAQIRALEGDVLSTWPALETTNLAGWQLNAADGVTGRANSVTVLDPDTGDPSPRIDRVERWYRQRGLRPRFRITPLSGPRLAEQLMERGYTDRNGQTDTLVLDDLTVGPPSPSVVISPTSDPNWWRLTERPHDQHPVLQSMLAPLGDRAAYATLTIDGHAVAVGTVITVGPRATLVNVNTQSAHRGQGHARALVETMHRHALDHGARSVFLNVMHDNTPAQRLYRSLGYRFAYPYHYLEAPQP